MCSMLSVDNVVASKSVMIFDRPLDYHPVLHAAIFIDMQLNIRSMGTSLAKCIYIELYSQVNPRKLVQPLGT